MREATTSGSVTAVCATCTSAAPIPLASALRHEPWTCSACGAVQTIPAAKVGMAASVLPRSGERSAGAVFSESYRPLRADAR